MTIYVVDVTLKETGEHKVSGEGYDSYAAAKQYAMSRIDHPTMTAPMRFESGVYLYKIIPITVKEDHNERDEPVGKSATISGQDGKRRRFRRVDYR